MMRSASRQALAALQEQAQSVTSGRISVASLETLAGELYAVADVLVAQPQLRRVLADPATAGDGRAALIGQIFHGKIGANAEKIAAEAARQRWSSSWDLTDALEGAGDDALFAAGEKDGVLDRIEDELFRLERILDDQGEVVGLLDEPTVDVARRNSLLDSLVDGKVHAITLQLLHHAVGSQRKRSILLAIDDLLEAAAARQHRSVARVMSASPLTDAQEERLAAALSTMYGRPILVRSALDPALRGGLVIRVGDELIDGSVASRFAEIRTSLAG